MNTSSGEIQNRIVVGVDLSETGDYALREALRWGQLLPGSELHVTYVIEAGADLHDANRLKSMADELPARINDLRARVTQLCASPWSGETLKQAAVLHVRIGNPAQALVQVAVDVDAEMIVIGTHQRSGLERLLLGSAAEELVRIAPLPVVVARPKDLSALKKSEHPEPRHAGADLREVSAAVPLHLEFVPRTSHISGLI